MLMVKNKVFENSLQKRQFSKTINPSSRKRIQVSKSQNCKLVRLAYLYKWLVGSTILHLKDKPKPFFRFAGILHCIHTMLGRSLSIEIDNFRCFHLLHPEEEEERSRFLIKNCRIENAWPVQQDLDVLAYRTNSIDLL